MPKRIQRQRTKGWRMPEGAKYVGRPTQFGNPFKVGFFTDPIIGHVDPALAVELHRVYVEHKPFLQRQIRLLLRGRDLCCWCPLDQPCHADTLLKVANTPSPVTITLTSGPVCPNCGERLPL